MSTEPTLTEFLLARIAEDEAHARHAAVPVWRHQLWGGEDRIIDVDDEDDPVVAVFNGLDMDAMHAGRWFPARVLAECEAKRLIVGWVSNVETWGEDQDAILGWLALPYADHPDYPRAVAS